MGRMSSSKAGGGNKTSLASVDDIVVAAIAGEIDLAHGIGREPRRAAALTRAFLIGVVNRLPYPPAENSRDRTAAVCEFLRQRAPGG